MVSPTTLVDAGRALSVLGVSRRTLDRLVAAGQLHPLRTYPRGPRQFKLAEVEALRDARSLLVAS